METKKIISIITPSYYCTEKEISDVKENLENWGFEKINDFTSKKQLFGKWAGEPKERLKKFNQAWNYDDGPIICCKGGSGLSHFIQKINKNFLKRKKIFVGYSDVTFLLNFINHKLKIITIHGPNALKDLDSQSIYALKNAMNMENYSLKFSKNNSFNFSDKKINGKIVGGNIGRLVELLQWVKLDFNSKIIFLEETGISEYHIFNYLNSLKNLKSFNPKAIIFGSLNVENDSLMKEMIKHLFPEIPLIFDLPAGHCLPNISIPIGSDCEIDIKEEKINFSFPEKDKEYALNYDFGKNPFKNTYSDKIKGKKFLFHEMTSINSMLKNYKGKNLIDYERLIILKNENKINYISSPIKIGSKKYLIAEFLDSNSTLLRKENYGWVVDSSLDNLELKELQIFKISDGFLITGKKQGKIQVFFGKTINRLKKLKILSERIDDIALLQNGSKIEIIFKQEYLVKFLRVNSIKEINQKSLSESKELFHFEKEETGNIVQLLKLKGGKIGVLGNFFRTSSFSKNNFGYPFIFVLNPKTKEVSSRRIILRRGELPDGECLSPEFYNLIFAGGLIRKKDKTYLYATIGKYNSYIIQIKDPFKYYEENF